ncbi:MAG: hypothetical protein JXB62_21210 [Pirellulales bacterium]|nr:hypothetical protein [Pirellulales bacterium]
MEINRNQYFLAGLVLLFLGIQFRLVDSFVLTPEVTQFLAERSGHPIAAVNSTAQLFAPEAKPIVKKTVRAPEWLGWALASVGSVLILHSLGMKRPE